MLDFTSELNYNMQAECFSLHIVYVFGEVA